MDAAVIEVLEKAGNQDPNVFKAAEEKLREWEITRGFYSALFNVFSNYSLPIDVRWMATLCFKNGVDKYWRNNAPNGIEDDEKEFLRQGLLGTLDEPVNQLAVHRAIIIGKIARLDSPREWDCLIPRLIQLISGQNALSQHRALLTLHHVVKTLASKRLLADRNRFEQLTADMFNFILNLWNRYTESFLILSANGADENQIYEQLEMALLLLRILRRFIVNGFRCLSKSQDAMMFLKVIFERSKSCLECRKTMTCRGLRVDSLEKFIIHLTKILNGALESHPSCYIDLIVGSLELTVFYCFTEAGKPFTFEKFIIQCLNLMKTILIHPMYRKITISDGLVVDGDRENRAQRAFQLKEDFFTPEILKEICSKLVTHYFLMTQADLEMWDSDPENFAVDDGKESWRYHLRTCTQTVFLSIFPQFSKTMASVLIELIKRYYQPVDPRDWHAILMKDAVYLAVGLVAHDLYDEVDFNQWFSTTLSQELEVKSENYRIIKRRVCWLIGKWTRVKLSEKLKPDLYKMMIKALSPEEDLVVRLEASNTLKQAIDDFQFHIDEFAPFLETTFSMLFNLLQEVSECDTKMQVLYVMSFVIECVGNNIRPYVGGLSVYLASLWHTSEQHNMLRCAIISTLVHYVKALSSDCAIVEPMVVSMVGISCDLNQNAHVYLMEDGLELWLALVENTATPTAGMIDLLQNMPALLDSGLDQVTFKPAINIIQGYVLLLPQNFLGEVGTRIIQGIKGIMSDLKSQEALPVLELLDLILRVAPEQGTQLIKPVLGKVFITVYMDDDYEMIMTITLSLVIIARVFLGSREVFAQVIAGLAQEIGQDETEESVMGRIIEVWLLRMVNVSQAESAKVLGLALCPLLTLNSPTIVHQHFTTIITNIVELLNDITLTDDSNSYYDSLIFNSGSNVNNSFDEDGEFKTEHQIRMKRLALQDPVHTVCMKNLFQNQLIALRRSMGLNEFDQMIASIPEITQQLNEYISF